MDEKRVVTVFWPETEWQGDLIVQELKDAGLDAYLANRSSATLWGDTRPIAKLEIIVPEEEAAKAEEIIKEVLDQFAKPAEGEAALPEEEEPE
jgi:hypothetical protein